MPKQSRSRPRGSDDTTEVLRGKNRELQKTIKQLQNKVNQLEKQLGLKSTNYKPEPEPIKSPVNVRKYLCEECGKGEMKENPPLETPSGIMVFSTCEICKHRKRMK